LLRNLPEHVTIMNKLLITLLLSGSFLLSAQNKINQADFALLQKMEANRTEGKTKFWRFISDANKYVNIGIPVGLLVAGSITHDKEMRQNALYVATSTATTVIFTYTLKTVVKRPRPFQMHVNFTAVYQPREHSFPSGHTSSAFSTASAVSLAYPKWYVMAPSYLFAGAVGYSRMYLGVHYPSDVAAGAVLGTGTALGLQFMKK
jgi:membrane-associated phospholipid phosphatase